MQQKKRFVFMFSSVLIALTLLLAACGPAATPVPVEQAPAEVVAPTEAPPAAKVITVGVNSENPPWIFMDGGTMTGFEADIVEEFAKRAGYEIEYKSAPFATVLTGVQSGQWDVAMSSIWVKQERVEVMDFADPYYDAQIGLMAPTEGGITAFDQMKGLVFGSDTGSANESWLQEAQAKYGPYEVKSYDYWADAVMDLQAGRIDGVVVDAPIALYWIKQNPDAGISMPLYITDYNFAQSLAFQKGSPLVAEFNTVQNEMKKDGTLAAIHKKWFVSDPPADSCAINECPPYLPNEKPVIGLGSADQPIKVLFVPSVDANMIVTGGEVMAKALEEATGYKFEVSVPTSYAATIEEMCASPDDTMGFIPALGYVLANQLCGVDVEFKAVRYGASVYWAQYLVARDSDIQTLEDLNGKKWGATDPGSTSGYMVPAAMFKEMGITVGEIVETGGHNQAVTAVYNGQVDFATTFYSPPLKPEGEPAWVEGDTPDIPDELVDQCAVSEDGKKIDVW